MGCVLEFISSYVLLYVRQVQMKTVGRCCTMLISPPTCKVEADSDGTLNVSPYSFTTYIQQRLNYIPQLGHRFPKEGFHKV